MEFTVTDHIVGSYETKLALRGWQNWEDKAQILRDALVATGRYLGRPLTWQEVRDAGAEIDRREGRS
jgi:hypothetical protein